MTARLRRAYGASPAHLLAHLALLPLAAFALLQLARRGQRGADLRLAGRQRRRCTTSCCCRSTARSTGSARRATGPAVNYVRVPALISGAAAARRTSPAISGKGNGAFHGVSGLDYEGYLGALAARHRGAVPGRPARSTSGAEGGGSSS